MAQTPDIRIEEQGDLFMVTPLTLIAWGWLDNNIDVQGWQQVGESLACSESLVLDILQWAKEDGMVIG